MTILVWCDGPWTLSSSLSVLPNHGNLGGGTFRPRLTAFPFADITETRKESNDKDIKTSRRLPGAMNSLRETWWQEIYFRVSM